MSGRHNHHHEDHDEAMEWITDWDYERILPLNSDQRQQYHHSSAPASAPAASHQYHSSDADPYHHDHYRASETLAHHEEADDDDDDDASMDIMDEDDDAPLSLDHNLNHESSQEIAIFWTRASEELTDKDLNGMFGIANADHPLMSVSRRNSRESLGMFRTTEDEEMMAPLPAAADNSAVGVSTPSVVESSTVAITPGAPDDDDDDDSIMGPLPHNEGLLPPMSPSQLYSQGNAQYGMIESHKADDFKQEIVPSDSTGTHTTIDLMDDEEYEDEDDAEGMQAHGEEVSPVPSTTASATIYSYKHSASTESDAVFERQQQLLQQVLQQAPSSTAARRSTYELPRPSDRQQRLLQDLKEQRPAVVAAAAAKKAKASPPLAAASKPDEPEAVPQDPIFARQQQIFEEMRKHHAEKQQQQEEPNSPSRHHHGGHHHQYHPYYYPSASSPSYYSHSSPVSVTKTLTRAGMDSEEYHKVVARLTEKNLLERQRHMLQASMKRSLETRQALHIKPTALPDYNHDKLSRVLKDIESSTRSISETYGRR